MSLSTFSGDFIDTALSQLGASRIKVVSGKQHVVDFDLGEGLTLTYIFTITNENRCYLQRARPYPMVQGRLASTEEVLQFIARDRQAFQPELQHLSGHCPEDLGADPQNGGALYHPQPESRGPGPSPSARGSIDRAHGRNPCPFPRGLL